MNNAQKMAAKLIDLTKWCSQSYLAKKLNVDRSTVSKWVERGKLEHIYVEELQSTLVRNVLKVNELPRGRKKIKK